MTASRSRNDRTFRPRGAPSHTKAHDGRQLYAYAARAAWTRTPRVPTESLASPVRHLCGTGGRTGRDDGIRVRWTKRESRRCASQSPLLVRLCVKRGLAAGEGASLLSPSRSFVRWALHLDARRLEPARHAKVRRGATHRRTAGTGVASTAGTVSVAATRGDNRVRGVVGVRQSRPGRWWPRAHEFARNRWAARSCRQQRYQLRPIRQPRRKDGRGHLGMRSRDPPHGRGTAAFHAVGPDCCFRRFARHHSGDQSRSFHHGAPSLEPRWHRQRPVTRSAAQRRENHQYTKVVRYVDLPSSCLLRSVLQSSP